MSSGHSTSEQVKLRHPSQRSSMQPANIHENAAGRSKPGKFSTFQVGVSEDRNLAWRSTMEDTHSYVYDFQGVHFVNTARDSSIKASSPVIEKVYAETDNGYAAIFDGHAGAVSAEWCGKNIHVILQRLMEENPGTSPPVLLDRAFTEADETMKDLGMYSGCTAVVAVLRWEDRISLSSSVDASSKTTPSPKIDADNPSKSKESEFKPISGNDAPKSRQRVLYTANVGDARAVLCRDGKALRLSYDHKASDANERKRIDDAGGLVVGSRVNGVLAVTRALGDSYLKPFVTGHPFTTETQIQPDTDEFLILACDGLWDVCTDDNAVALVRNVADPQEASRKLVEYAKSHNSNDNLSCMVINFQSDKMKDVSRGANLPARLPPLKDPKTVQLPSEERGKPENKGKPETTRETNPDPVDNLPIHKLNISSRESSPKRSIPESKPGTEPGSASKSKSVSTPTRSSSSGGGKKSFPANR